MNHSLPLDLIDTPDRKHRQLFTELSPGVLELCIDNSTLEKLLTCPRSFELYAVFGRDVGNRDALNYGTAIHHALECYYLGGSLADMIGRVMDHFREHPCSENSWRNADHAIESCRRYVKWREQCPPIKVATLEGKPAVEIPFKLPLFTYYAESDFDTFNYPTNLIGKNISDQSKYFDHIDVMWTGKIDLIRQTDDPHILRPVDHKTTSIAGETYWSSFVLSCQMMGYCWATQELTGCLVDGVDIDAIIGRPASAKGAGIMHDNQWASYDYTQDQLLEWKRDVEHHIRELINNLLVGYFPKATTHCANKYGMCPYHDCCKQPNRETGARILMSGQYAEKVWNPLER